MGINEISKEHHRAALVVEKAARVDSEAQEPKLLPALVDQSARQAVERFFADLSDTNAAAHEQCCDLVEAQARFAKALGDGDNWLGSLLGKYVGKLVAKLLRLWK